MVNILLSLRIFDQPIIKEALKPYINPDSKVTVLTYSFFKMFCSDEDAYEAYYQEGGEYFDKIWDSFSVFDIKKDNFFWIDYYKDSKDEAIKKINAADVIYFPGGAPDEMMDRIREKGLIDALSDPSKTYIGVSAGTMIQFKNYYISPDAEYPKFSEESGLGLVDGFYGEVHYRRRKKQKSSIRKIWRKYHKNMYVIPNDGCIIVDKNGIKTIGTAKQLYDKKGVIK